jgi:hypothetical protein
MALAIEEMGQKALHVLGFACNGITEAAECEKT